MALIDREFPPHVVFFTDPNGTNNVSSEHPDKEIFADFCPSLATMSKSLRLTPSKVTDLLTDSQPLFGKSIWYRSFSFSSGTVKETETSEFPFSFIERECPPVLRR